MAKHHLKSDKLQVNEVSSLETIRIFVKNILTYSEGFTLDDFDLVNKLYVDSVAGSLKTTIDKTEADLLETAVDSGIWYLPLLDEAGDPLEEEVVPIFITVDDLQFNGYQTDFTVTPPRIYGFLDDSTKTIKITVI